MIIKNPFARRLIEEEFRRAFKESQDAIKAEDSAELKGLTREEFCAQRVLNGKTKKEAIELAAKAVEVP